MKKTLVFYILSIFSNGLIAQNPELDSLQKVLKTQKEDTNKVNTLNLLCGDYYKIGDLNNAVEYGKKALVLVEKLNFTGMI